ncbi:RecQ family ATP-dependent DNA helicase [Candidatus Pseudothioglobus singularis]|nr:RecQ family ATP-dependent DNA helicase [Candidatus Pseudothioglobus singularis]
MLRYTANYSNSNQNFVIQNFVAKRKDDRYLPAICILKNILQRGSPTLMSSFLQEKLGSIHQNDDFNQPYPLIDSSRPDWKRVIRGDVEGDNFPAKRFFEDLIPKYLSDYQYIQQLIIPEIPINEITKVNVKEFSGQQVDFYLQQAFLIIEIDGSQHDSSRDVLRDNYAKKYGIKTIRIKVSDLNEENSTFKKKIEEIKERIDKVSSSKNELTHSHSNSISLEDYSEAHKNGLDINNPYYKSTAVIRFQLLILDLLESGTLRLNKDWKIELIERDSKDFAELAIQDLFVWFENLLQLHKISFSEPKVNIKKITSIDEFSNDQSTIKVDFSLLKRYTDEFQDHPNVYFIRTDYLDEYRYFKKGNSTNNLNFSSFKRYDYFQISTTKLIDYKIKLGGKNSDEKPLIFLLWNLFLQNDPSLSLDNLAFREGQLPIIVSALSNKDTIGLLPTGSGKSVCYQLSAILQPAISFVVCPIISLMLDQKADLDLTMFSRTNHITSMNDGEEKGEILNEFSRGKYFFIYISPERFQSKSFREEFSLVNKNFNIAYAVIDEVHCLSEWGHDFRPAYLTLADTIEKLSKSSTYIGLTATASTNVLKDIQVEFSIDRQNIKTPLDYTREELEFVVIDDEGNKDALLINILEDQIDDIGALEVKGLETKSGIIFTTKKSGKDGCFQLSQRLSKYFDEDVRFFSGTVPTKFNLSEVGTYPDYGSYKKKVQDDFKQNKFSLLAATKAFGMGINKGNIYYTIHYGLPSSIEALYQEAGRAGRDKSKFLKQPAKCFLALTKTAKNDALSDLWEPNTPLSKIKKFEKTKKYQGDIATQVWFFSQSNDLIKDEYALVRKIYDKYASSKKQNVELKSKDINSNKTKTEYALYRLKQLGIVSDWTINNFITGVFYVDFLEFSETKIKNNLELFIQNYDKEFSFENLKHEAKYANYKSFFERGKGDNIKIYIVLLLQWSYDNQAYSQRQSLKNVYENSCSFADGEITSLEFKNRLENYFKNDELTGSFQNIADNPKDFKGWFKVFYKAQKNQKPNIFINKEEQAAERDSLSRFLESYMHNTGLDTISGLLRLLLDEYDNSDGRSRLESSLEQIKNFSSKDQEFIINEILNIGLQCDSYNKSLLSESLYKHYDSSKDFLWLLSEKLNDSFSIEVIVTNINQKLISINEENYGRLKKTG